MLHTRHAIMQGAFRAYRMCGTIQCIHLERLVAVNCCFGRICCGGEANNVSLASEHTDSTQKSPFSSASKVTLFEDNTTREPCINLPFVSSPTNHKLWQLDHLRLRRKAFSSSSAKEAYPPTWLMPSLLLFLCNQQLCAARACTLSPRSLFFTTWQSHPGPQPPRRLNGWSNAMGARLRYGYSSSHVGFPR